MPQPSRASRPTSLSSWFRFAPGAGRGRRARVGSRRNRPGLERFEDRALLSGVPALQAIPAAAPSILPVAHDDVIDTDEGNPVPIPILANDVAPSGFATSPTGYGEVTITSPPGHGSVKVDISGVATYSPTTGFYGTDHFQYTFHDSNGTVSNAANVTVVVNRPSANDDFASTPEATPVAIDVVANDTDPDGNGRIDRGTVSIGSFPAHGSATVNTTTGAITYTPTAGFVGTDRLTYTIQDVASATSNPATVTIAVTGTSNPVTTPTPSPVVANSAGATTDGIIPVAIDVLGNDSAPNGLNPGSVALASQPSGGTAVISPAGLITYTPKLGFFGTDTFSYTVQDLTGNTSAPALISVVVTRPTANDNFTENFGDTPATIDVTDNDAAAGANYQLVPSSVTVVTAPSHGTTSIDPATGNVIYTPTFGYFGTDTFAYTVQDSAGATSNAATVTAVTDLGTISGVVFLSYTGGTTQVAGDPGVANQPLYLDLNHDGQYEAGEPATTTNLDGQYTFPGLDAGTYTVRELTPPNSSVVQTSVPSGSYTVAVTPDNSIVTGPAIGNVVVSPIAPLLVTADLFPVGLKDPVVAFAQGASNSVLGQVSDPAALAKLTAHDTHHGVVDRLAVAKAIWESPAHRTAQAITYYQTFLGRTPTAKELGAVVRSLRQGAGETAVVASLLNSREYRAAHPDATSYAQAVYQTTLGRLPTAAELASAKATIGAHGKGSQKFAASVLNSDEALTTVINGFNAAILQRPANPFALPGAVQKARGRKGIENAAVTLLASSDFYAKAAASTR